MSSNRFPEPPKLSGAKDLMNKNPSANIENTGDAVSHAEAAIDSEPTKAETVETLKPTDTARTHESVLEEGTNPAEPTPLDEFAEELVASENSEHSDGTTDNAEQKEQKAEKEESFGPWEIIGHTGYLPTILWGLLTAAATGAAGMFFAPGEYTWIPLAVLGFVTGVIAAVDRKTHLIKNQHTIVAAILTVPLAGVIAFTLGPWNLFFGLLGAVVTFGFFIFLVLKVGFGSGGDIKFSPVPAFVLGVINPLITALWLFYALIITLVLLVVGKKKATSFGEGMAIALPLAVVSVFALYQLAGLPYMEMVSNL